jgi:hypothetical protein
MGAWAAAVFTRSAPNGEAGHAEARIRLIIFSSFYIRRPIKDAIYFRRKISLDLFELTGIN